MGNDNCGAFNVYRSADALSGLVYGVVLDCVYRRPVSSVF